jgi:hypothetical protein
MKINKKFRIDKSIVTYGNGLWSSDERKVDVTKATLQIHEFDSPTYKGQRKPYQHGELRVYFTKKSWNPDKHGLIYTDAGWLRGLHAILSKKGFSPKAVKGVDYTEQGMQGDNFVSLDVNSTFCTEWVKKKYPFKKETYDW